MKVIEYEKNWRDTADPESIKSMDHNVANSGSCYPRKKTQAETNSPLVFGASQTSDGKFLGVIELCPLGDYEEEITKITDKAITEKEKETAKFYLSTLQSAKKYNYNKRALYVSMFDTTTKSIFSDQLVEFILQFAMRKSFELGYDHIIIEVVGRDKRDFIHNRMKYLQNTLKLEYEKKEYGEETFSCSDLISHGNEEELMFSALALRYCSSIIVKKRIQETNSKK